MNNDALADRRRLGWTDLHVSPLALGTMQFGWTMSDVQSMELLDRYVELGGNFIDTADMYGPNQNWRSYERCKPHLGISEDTIGRWAQDRALRDQIVIATKVRAPMWDGTEGAGLSRAHITRAVDGSLRRLRTDRIDLYQAHWPDDTVPLEETMQTFADLVSSGKVRYIGVSNYVALGQLEPALRAAAGCGLRLASEQPRYNLVNRDEYEKALEPVVEREHLGVICYSPLASGFLTGKYRNQPRESVRARYVAQYLNDDGNRLTDNLIAAAEKHHATPAAVALAWVIAQPGITSAIVGANSLAQLEDWAPAATLQLDDDELVRLGKLGWAASRPEYTSW